MLTNRYLTSVKNLPGIMQKIVEGTAPERFTLEHLKGIGFKGSGDRAVVPLLKELGFLSSDGVPTERYHAYRNQAQSKAILGEALRGAYEDIFHINERPTDADRAAIEGKFRSVHNTTDRVAECQAMTFFALLKLADLDAVSSKAEPTPPEKELKKKKKDEPPKIPPVAIAGLGYKIEINLPATKDPDVYNAIFTALKEHLLEH